jgi:hypothetical protein
MLAEALGDALIDRRKLPDFDLLANGGGGGVDAPVSTGLLDVTEPAGASGGAVADRKLQGTFVGAGFGTSFVCLRKLFSQDLHVAVLCSKDPYVYLVGKILVQLLRKADSFPEVLLHIVNRRMFEERFQEAILDEPPISPVFLRCTREEMTAKLPAEVTHLRMALYAQWSLPGDSAGMLQFLDTSRSKKLLTSQRGWIDAFLENRASETVRELDQQFGFFSAVAERMYPVCADMFHPYFWGFLATQRSWWNYPSAVYVSREAPTREDGGPFKIGQATLSLYDAEIFRAFAEEVKADLYYLYSLKDDPALRISREAPERGLLIASVAGE